MPLTDAQHAAVDTFLAKYAGEDAPLVKALLTDGELSTGDPTAVSPKGARGLMQLTPIALEETGRDPKTFDYNNPAESLKAGTDYVRILRDKYGFTNPLQIAAAYNAGPSRVQAAVKAGSFKTLPAETQAYIVRMAKVLPGVRQATSAQAAETVPAPPADTAAPSDVEQPFVRPEDMSNVAPPQPPEAVTTPTSLAKQVGSGLVEGAANVVDLAGTVFNLVPGPIRYHSISDRVAGYLSGPPQTTAERYGRAGARGVGATVATGGTSLPAVALGVASGLGSEGGGDLSQKYLGTRRPGEIVGGLAPVAGVVGYRALSARAARQAAEAEAVRQVEAKLSMQSPLERATTARGLLQKNTTFVKEFNSQAWDDFLGKYGQIGVPLDDVRNLSAKGIIDDAMSAGLSRDAAVAKADKIMSLVAPNGQTVDALPFAQAKELRSELGQITEKASRGATRFRAGSLYGQLSKTMESVLPTDAARTEWSLVNQTTKQEVELLRNTFVKRAIDARPQGQATADKYMTGILEGGFTPARQVEVRALLKAGGDELKPVLGDALLRTTIRNNVIGTGESARIDWKGVAMALRDPQQARDLSVELFGAREQQTLIKLAETAGEADPRSVLNLVGHVAMDLTGGAMVRAATGRPGLGEAWVGYRALAALRDPANRALLKRASKTIADSVKGREILRALLVRPGEFVTPPGAVEPEPAPSTS